VVGFDSIILPGREGFITQKTELKNLHGSGEYVKALTVTSDAKNTPTLRLSMKFSLKGIVNVVPSYLAIGKAQPVDVTLSTEKADLKIKRILFKETEITKSNWQADLPTFLTFVVTKPDSVRKDGYRDYKVTLSHKLDLEAGKNGNYIIETNHPEKPEISIKGRLEK